MKATRGSTMRIDIDKEASNFVASLNLWICKGLASMMSCHVDLPSSAVPELHIQGRRGLDICLHCPALTEAAAAAPASSIGDQLKSSISSASIRSCKELHRQPSNNSPLPLFVRPHHKLKSIFWPTEMAVGSITPIQFCGHGGQTPLCAFSPPSTQL
jgi:hypothetical protein